MSKLIMFNMMSLDGFFERVNHDLDWHVTDEEFDQFSIEQLHQAGAILFGRKTYQMMAEFWPSETAIKEDAKVAELMNSLPKFVFSRTLESVKWQNSTLIHGDCAAEVRRLKEASDKDLILFGSADLMVTLIKEGLIDEFRLMINPVLLGSGRPLFADPQMKLRFDLLNVRTFQSGNILLSYKIKSG